MENFILGYLFFVILGYLFFVFGSFILIKSNNDTKDVGWFWVVFQSLTALPAMEWILNGCRKIK